METTKTLNVRAEIIDPSIENALPENCTMSILFQKDGLVFSILRNDMRKFIVIGDYQMQEEKQALAELFSFKERLPGQFANTHIGYFSPHFTLVPAPLFNQEKLAEYAKFQFDLPPNHQLMFDELKSHSLVLIYSVPKETKTIMGRHFSGIALKHAATFSIEYYLNQHKNKPGQHVYVNIWAGHLEILVIENGKLLLFNSFYFDTAEDLLYFILNVYEQLELNPENVPLKIAGDLAKNDDRWALLQKYIRFVEAEEKPAGHQFSHEFKLINNHLYNRIFQTALCA